MNKLYLTLSIIFFNVYFVSCYRQIHFTNADACDTDGKTKTLHIGEGALVLYLNNDSFDGMGHTKLHGEKKICNLLVKSRKGLGLLVYAEELDLREENSLDKKVSCVDYVEFGQEDVIPFITLKRSGRLCGHNPGAVYDDPEGQLLIWLKLGPYNYTPDTSTALTHTSVTSSRLTLVITPYYKSWKDIGRNEVKKCTIGDYWIRKNYFCDGRVNCPMDLDFGSDKPPLDEADKSCATTPAPPTTTTTTTQRHLPFDDTYESFSESFSFVVIVLISVVGLLVIACGIVCTLKRCRLGPLPRTPDSDNCPETSFGMLQVSRSHGGPGTQENTYVTHPPCPRRPTDFSPPELSPSWTMSGDRGASSGSGVTGNTTSIRMPKQSPLLNRNITEAPPPSYNEIFPPDFVPDPQIMRGASNQQETNQETTNTDTNV